MSLGYFEKIEECIDLDVARENDVAIVRRMSGGSAIYTDPGQIIYSLVLSADAVPESPNETFRLICGGVVEALDSLGLKAEHKPVNDVLVRGKKISGSAQIRRYGVVVQHGTLIIKGDRNMMFRVLRSKKRSSDQMTSLEEELGRTVAIKEATDALVHGFSSAFGIDLVSGELTDRERELKDELAKNKYASLEHTNLR